MRKKPIGTSGQAEAIQRRSKRKRKKAQTPDGNYCVGTKQRKQARQNLVSDKLIKGKVNKTKNYQKPKEDEKKKIHSHTQTQ